jgi:enoyl-CoA hydratase/carnithine racemase
LRPEGFGGQPTEIVMAGHIIVTDEGATRTIVMRRPEKKNALTPEIRTFGA